MNILIVEDEKKVGQFVERSLKDEGYSTAWVNSCRSANDALAESPFDAVILDLGLPDGDGLKLLGDWRSRGFNEPVLILSARDEVRDRIKGLNVGGDDYLPKPFSIEELLARLRSLLRRRGENKVTRYKRGGIVLDRLARTVQLNGKNIDLTTREFALLELFMQNKKRVLTRTLIAEKIWDSHDDLDTNLLDVYMRHLRVKLDIQPDKPVFKTVRGVGYQML